MESTELDFHALVPPELLDQSGAGDAETCALMVNTVLDNNTTGGRLTADAALMAAYFVQPGVKICMVGEATATLGSEHGADSAKQMTAMTEAGLMESYDFDSFEVQPHTKLDRIRIGFFRADFGDAARTADGLAAVRAAFCGASQAPELASVFEPADFREVTEDDRLADETDEELASRTALHDRIRGRVRERLIEIAGASGSYDDEATMNATVDRLIHTASHTTTGLAVVRLILGSNSIDFPFVETHEDMASLSEEARDALRARYDAISAENVVLDNLDAVINELPCPHEMVLGNPDDEVWMTAALKRQLARARGRNAIRGAREKAPKPDAILGLPLYVSGERWTRFVEVHSALQGLGENVPSLQLLAAQAHDAGVKVSPLMLGMAAMTSMATGKPMQLLTAGPAADAAEAPPPAMAVPATISEEPTMVIEGGPTRAGVVIDEEPILSESESIPMQEGIDPEADAIAEMHGPSSVEEADGPVSPPASMSDSDEAFLAAAAARKPPPEPETDEDGEEAMRRNNKKAAKKPGRRPPTPSDDEDSEEEFRRRAAEAAAAAKKAKKKAAAAGELSAFEQQYKHLVMVASLTYTARDKAPKATWFDAVLNFARDMGTECLRPDEAEGERELVTQRMAGRIIKKVAAMDLTLRLVDALARGTNPEELDQVWKDHAREAMKRLKTKSHGRERTQILKTFHKIKAANCDEWEEALSAACWAIKAIIKGEFATPEEATRQIRSLITRGSIGRDAAHIAVACLALHTYEE